MPFVLGANALAAGYRLAAYDEIGSTSTEAATRAAAGDPGRLWVVAREQTAGHGRRGRHWLTPSGNLAASLLIVHPGGAPSSATLGFAAGLALEAAIRAAAPQVDVRVGLDAATGEGSRLALKWPNDVLVDGAKVAGILLEAATLPNGMSSVVIGIGVNVLHAPAGMPYPVASLATCGAADLTAEGLFAALSDTWVEQEDLWNDGRGFAAIRARWLCRAAGLGAPIAIATGDDVLRGTFETIDEEGRLIVRTSNGSARAVSAGEVHLGAAATVR